MVKEYGDQSVSTTPVGAAIPSFGRLIGPVP
jgi:hypothetical protein